MLDLVTAALAPLSEWRFPEIDPALLTIPSFEAFGAEIGPFPLRFYALAYIVGILAGWRYAVVLANRHRLWTSPGSPISQETIDDFVFYCILGILLGGRIGYVLFYLLPFAPERVADDPLTIFRIWEGGMSFHGGLIGVALALLWTAHARKVSLFSLSDVAAAATPIGIFLGRLANFINAELYGRPTDAPWAMKFPTYDWAREMWVYTGEEVARHPSQLYEAALEGVVLLAILAVAVWRFDALKKPGLVAGLFLIGYAAARSFVELFREPDAHIGFLPGGITMGMTLSAPMIALGLWLILTARRRGEPA